MAEDIVSDVIDEIIDDVEKVFPPKPGGIIDRHRQEKARREEAERERENIDARVEQASYKAVKVASIQPEVFNSITYTIQPSGNAPVLPLNLYRARSVLLVITPGTTVILAKDQGVASSGVGFTLPYGIPVTLMTRGQVYAVNNTGVIVQVSVMAESYAPEAM